MEAVKGGTLQNWMVNRFLPWKPLKSLKCVLYRSVFSLKKRILSSMFQCASMLVTCSLSCIWRARHYIIINQTVKYLCKIFINKDFGSGHNHLDPQYLTEQSLDANLLNWPWPPKLMKSCCALLWEKPYQHTVTRLFHMCGTYIFGVFIHIFDGDFRKIVKY